MNIRKFENNYVKKMKSWFEENFCYNRKHKFIFVKYIFFFSYFALGDMLNINIRFTKNLNK